MDNTAELIAQLSNLQQWHEHQQQQLAVTHTQQREQLSLEKFNVLNAIPINSTGKKDFFGGNFLHRSRTIGTLLCQIVTLLHSIFLKKFDPLIL